MLQWLFLKTSSLALSDILVFHKLLGFYGKWHFQCQYIYMRSVRGLERGLEGLLQLNYMGNLRWGKLLNYAVPLSFHTKG